MNLVVGATGIVGGMIAEKLLDRGEKVRALVRPNSAERTMGPHTDPMMLEAKGGEIVAGDLTEPESLPSALIGVRRVFFTANSAKRTPDFEAVDWQGTRDFITAAKEAGVEQFLYTLGLRCRARFTRTALGRQRPRRSASAA